MEAIYDYETGTVKRDFKIVRCGDKCRLSGLPTWVGGGRCKKCKHCGETFMLPSGFYMACSHPEQEDTKDWMAISDFSNRIKHEAMCALCR